MMKDFLNEMSLERRYVSPLCYAKKEIYMFEAYIQPHPISLNLLFLARLYSLFSVRQIVWQSDWTIKTETRCTSR